MVHRTLCDEEDESSVFMRMQKVEAEWKLSGSYVCCMEDATCVSRVLCGPREVYERSGDACGTAGGVWR